MARRRTHSEEFQLPLLAQRTTSKYNDWEYLLLLSSQVIPGPTALGSWASHPRKWHLMGWVPCPCWSHPDWDIRTSELLLSVKSQLKSPSSDPPSSGLLAASCLCSLSRHGELSITPL